MQLCCLALDNVSEPVDIMSTNKFFSYQWE